MTNIYFANDLFTEESRLWNKTVVDKIRNKYGNKVSIYLPQENQSINDKSKYANSIDIAKADTERLDKSDILIAVLDGLSIGAGTATEIGMFANKHKPIIGVYTDVRQKGADCKAKLDALSDIAENQFFYINLFTVGKIKQNGEIVTSSKQLIDVLNKYVRDDKNE